MTEPTASASRRPAEVQLVTQLQKEREAVLDGFESRRDVIRWGQRIAVRALGQVPQRRYEQLATSFRPDENHMEGPLLAAFLDEDARTREMRPEAVEGLRERWAADVLGPVSVRSFRDLRKDAGEYIGETEDNDGEPGYDPAGQAFAMRPALKELDESQASALEMVLGGLEGKESILAWGDYLTQATRGEPVDVDRGPGTFVKKCYQEPSSVRLLTDTSPPWQRAREAFLAQYLLPAFNRGVRDLTSRTTEEPTEDEDGGMSDAPSW